MVWRTNCHVVRKTIVDLFKDNAEEFIEDWYELTWTISCKRGRKHMGRSVKVAVPDLKMGQTRMYRMQFQPHWLVIDSKNQGYYVCQTCKEEFYEASL